MIWVILCIFVLLVGYTVLVLLTPNPPPLSKAEQSFLSPDSPAAAKPLPSLTDEASLDLSIVVPAYNESTRLPVMLTDTLQHLFAPSTPKRTFEIIIVDDGSKDNTSSVALQFLANNKQFKGADVRVVKLEKNRGKGGAVQAGFLGARGKRILMVDADGASRFADLEELWKEMDDLLKTYPNAGGRGIAVGSRAHLVGTEAVVKRSAIRNFLMHSFHLTLRTLGVGHIRDTQCGFKLFTRPAAQLLLPPLHIHSWLFDVELLILAQYLSIPVAEVPVGWHEVEGSKLQIVSASVGMLKDLVVLRANYGLRRWKVPKAN